MTPRIRLFITLALVSHVLLLVPLVTSQLPPEKEKSPKSSLSSRITGSAAAPSDEVVIRARQQEKIGDTYKLRGDVEITYRNYTLRAEDATYDSKTGEAQASGGVTLDGGPRDEHLSATHATYNVASQSGTFFDVIGLIGAIYRGKSLVLTTTNPFILTGRRVEKIGLRYIVYHGTITSCALPHPKWRFDAAKIDVVPGAEAKVYHSDFRLFGMPLLYLPFAEHPVDNLGRRSGFLLPVIGVSNKKGLILGDGVFWAINRSTDLTAGAEYFSTRGWSQNFEFRARPSETASLGLRYFGVLDRGDPDTHQKQGGEDVKFNGEWQRAGWRAVASVNYLSSFLFRLAWSPTFNQAIDSEVHANGFLSKNFNGYSFGILASRYQNFQSITVGDEIRILHMPSASFSSVDRPLSSTPLTWGFDSSLEGLSRTEPDFRTSTLAGRLDARPRAALPLHFHDWSIRPEIAVRETYYTEQVGAGPAGTVGSLVKRGLNRQDVELSVELRPPALARVFDREVFGRQLKHVIEPRVTYTRVAGLNNFDDVIRFDARDILSNTNEVEAGIVNRIYAKQKLPRSAAGCELPAKTGQNVQGRVGTGKIPSMLPGATAPARKCEDQGSTTRELLRWEVKQKYFFDPTFGNAIVPGQRNVVTSSVDFAGIAFLTGPRRWSPVVSLLRLQPSANTDVQWELDYDHTKGQINASTAFVDYRIGNIFIGGSQMFFRVPGEIVAPTAITPPPEFNQFRLLLGYGHPNKRGLSSGVSFGIDEHFSYLQYAAAQTSYNWDCCGLSFEYRRFTLGSTTIGSVRNENQFRFTLTLANVGSFGNLRRQESLF
jgi:LPS-assembly protein